MAISKSVTLNSGLSINNAYIKLSFIGGNKNGISYEMRIYASKQASDEGKDFLEQKIYSFVPNQDEKGLRWDKQAYEHFKSFPENQDSVDC